MEKPLIVRDSKIILALGILCTALFTLCLIFSVRSCLGKQDMESLIFCAMVFGGFTLLGLLLCIYCIRRKLVLYDNHLTYTPSFGRMKSFSYSEIQSVVQKNEKFIIYSYDGTKLAVFENNMPMCYAALYLLNEKYVKIIPQAPSASVTALNRKITDWNKRMHLTDKAAYLKSRYSAETIRKQKRIIRITKIALIILSLLAVSFSTKWRLAAHISILLFHYLLFLFFYPKMTLESAKNCDEYHIPFPMAGGIICLLFLTAFITTINMEDDRWLGAAGILFLILLIPFLLMLCLRKIREHPFRLLAAAIVLFLLAFCVTPAAAYAASYKPVHDKVIVLDKQKYRGSRSTSYDIIVIWRGREQKMDVSGSLYNSVNVGDTVRVCARRSFLGMELWQMHK